MKFKKFTLAIFFTFFSLFSFVNPLYAQTDSDSVFSVQNNFEPLSEIPGITHDEHGNPVQLDLGTFLTNTFNFLVASAIVVAIVMITVGGFQYLTSVAVGGKEEAKARIQNSIQGLLLILLTYIILYTINPATVSLDFLSATRGDTSPTQETGNVIGYRYQYILSTSDANKDTPIESQTFATIKKCEDAMKTDERLTIQVPLYEEIRKNCKEATVQSEGEKQYQTQIKNTLFNTITPVTFETKIECDTYQREQLKLTRDKYKLVGNICRPERR